MSSMGRNKNKARALFRLAAHHDRCVSLPLDLERRISKLRVSATEYTREDLVGAMAAGAIRLYSDFPAPTYGDTSGTKSAQQICDALTRTRMASTIRTRCGQNASIRYFKANELVKKWRSDEARVNVPDYHVRGGPLERVIDPNFLREINLFPRASEETASLEMMSLVMSSRGVCAVSHSDDPDGSNHCFVGHKLWLMWDTHEGLHAGLEDCEKLDITRDPRFDLRKFCGLRSSRWLSIGPGETMFLPGNYSHRVVTLERYVGTGNFYFGVPNALRTLTRWMIHGCSWTDGEQTPCTDSIIRELLELTRRRILVLSRRSERFKQSTGYTLLPVAAHAWLRETTRAQRALLVRTPEFLALARAMGVPYAKVSTGA